jgi:hypothetical protein
MPVTEQDYRNIVARMRVDPLFKNLVLQIIRDNMDMIVAPVMREVDSKISKPSSTKRYY